MILRDRVPCRISPVGLLAAGLLALLALPSWVIAQQEAEKPRPEEKKIEVRVLEVDPSTVKVVPKDVQTFEYRIATDDDDDDDGDDDDKDKAKEKGKAKEKDKEKTKQQRRVYIYRAGPDDQGADKDKKEAKDDGKDDPKRAEELKRAREELKKAEADLAKASEDMRKAIRKIQERMREETQAAQKGIQEKSQDLMKARQKVAELEGRRLRAVRVPGTPGRMTFRFDGQELHVQPGPDGKLPQGLFGQPLKPGQIQGLPPGQFRTFTVPGPGSNSNLEKRMDALEKKFDKLLDELKDRKKSGSRSPNIDLRVSSRGRTLGGFDSRLGAIY